MVLLFWEYDRIVQRMRKRSASAPRRRAVRVLRSAAVATVLGFAAYGFAALLLADPSVGQWRTSEGRLAYERAHDEAIAAMPAPTVIRDVPTRFGTVRAYGWTSPAHHAELPIVLLPGRSSGVPMWTGQVHLLTPHRDVYAFEALGDAGRSVQVVPMRAYADQAVWVEDTLAGLKLKRAHMVGHSFGGATAAIHAQRNPERVASLTLLEPAFVLAYPPASIFVWATVATAPVPQAWRDHALARIGGVEVEDVRSDDPVGRMIELGAQHYQAALPTPKLRSPEDLRSLSMPVYVAIAERDSLAGGQSAVERSRALSRGTVQVWPDTTHSLPMQAGAALTDRLQQWWAQID